MSKNSMVCDLETGVCGIAGDEEMEIIDFNAPAKTVDLYYVTDPICSHCWALEPVLRRFEQQYGQYFRFHTVMGGLLESWDGFADVKNGINGPADVAGHWREVGEYSRMPIDGSLWLNNPVQSSFIPSRVYKIVQQKDEQLANTFLRRAREAVFAFNQNIAEDQVLTDIVNKLGLDGEAIIREAGSAVGHELLNQDFAMAAKLGVRGFPTIIMVNEENKGVKIVGSRPLEAYVQGLEQILPTVQIQANPVPSLEQMIKEDGLLFSKEIEVLYDLEQKEVDDFINEGLSVGTFKRNEILGENYIELVK